MDIEMDNALSIKAVSEDARPGYAFYFRNWKNEPTVFTPEFLWPKANRNVGLFVIYVAM